MSNLEYGRMGIMTDQQFYDTTIAHLLRQNQRALDDVGMFCRYRGVNNTRCAMGFHIPDELYDPAMEKLMSDLVLARWPALREFIPNPALMSDLQNLHDVANYWNDNGRGFSERGRERVRTIAAEFNLVPYVWS